jgi:hypothetical protein
LGAGLFRGTDHSGPQLFVRLKRRKWAEHREVVLGPLEKVEFILPEAANFCDTCYK